MGGSLNKPVLLIADINSCSKLNEPVIRPNYLPRGIQLNVLL